MTPTVIATRSDRIHRTLEHLRHQSTDTVGQLVSFGPGQYTDPGLARRERELVFGRVPSIVAHASELPEPNDFITLTMPRNRVIVARQPDGSVKAFVNVCRHRGAMLEEQASGRCRLFSCGYHRWSYNIDGSLRAITRENTFGEVDRSQHGLIELPAQERHGLIWMVDRAGAAIDVPGWLGPEMDAILAGYRLGELTAIRSEGYNVAPGEIESVISELPQVIEVCVVSAADPKFGEAPAAVIYATEAVTAEEVTAHCRERLAGYKVPRHVIVEAEPLERMASGKIARRKIRDAHPGLAADAQPVA